MYRSTHTARRRVAATLAAVAGAILIAPAALGAQAVEASATTRPRVELREVPDARGTRGNPSVTRGNAADTRVDASETRGSSTSVTRGGPNGSSSSGSANGSSNANRATSARDIPPGHLPPVGMCRVWFDDRAPGQQPAPTSCEEARRYAARNGGRVIYRIDGSRDRFDPRNGNDRDEWYDRDGRRRDRDDDDRYDRDDRYGRDGRDGRYDRDDRYDRDGRYGRDDRRYYPAALPRMIWAERFQRGQAVAEVRRWVGRTDVRPRWVDRNRNGRVDYVNWLDSRGTIVQRWEDTDRDGRADEVTVYRNGRIYRVIRD